MSPEASVLSSTIRFTLDGKEVEAFAGETIWQVANRLESHGNLTTSPPGSQLCDLVHYPTLFYYPTPARRDG